MKYWFCYGNFILYFKKKGNTVVFWVCEKLMLLKLIIFHSLTAWKNKFCKGCTSILIKKGHSNTLWGYREISTCFVCYQYLIKLENCFSVILPEVAMHASLS